MKIALMAAVTGMALMSVTAGAEVYVGVGAGITHSNAGQRLHQTFIYDSVSKKDDSDTGYTAYVGYSFNKNLAVEANYIDFGKYETTGTYSGYNIGTSLKAKAYGLSAVGTYPVTDRFGIDGKLGVGSLEQKFHCMLTNCNFQDTSKSELVPLFGLGAHWTVTKHVVVRGQYEQMGGHYVVRDNTGFSAKRSADYGLLSADVEVRF